MTDWRDNFHGFALAVAERLELGERAYGNRTFELPPSRIIAEAQDELLDNAAYSFIAWCRLERLRLKLGALDLRRPEEHPHHDNGEAEVENDLAENHALGVPAGKLEKVAKVRERTAHGEDTTVPSRRQET